MCRTRTLAVVSIALASLVLTAGCGGSGTHAPNGVGRFSTTTPDGLAVTTSGIERTSSTPSAVSSQNIVAAVGFAFSTGDQVEVTFAVDPLTDLALADPMAQSCRLESDPSRALVTHVRVSAKLTGSLPENFTLKFGRPVLIPLAIQMASGGQCLYPDPDAQLPISLTPGQSLPIDVWMLGDGAKTPTYPAGDPRILKWMTFNPSMHVGWRDMLQPDADIEFGYGSQVLACNLDNVHSVQTEIFADAGVFARGDDGCAPAATLEQFKGLEQKAGTAGATSP
ncbi:hypothetical protein Caci_7322 [Catenulispora acidiphila DSM 44928]|uniref:Lipoprotein n=1 Tax=Catenulispora acidiphila (strain DSM 44928 / JCM 14897 / NBRC 102108 / NRRL B-24433 / ID139908) TaxID=479433 RepID=C7Q8G3_CATAD|nr:hypothetical protein [Catenulispora acidiphila]ACU76151.1 hypothetical protein Caci_7322 [Catenulispora acidiphila DSM 44928]